MAGLGSLSQKGGDSDRGEDLSRNLASFVFEASHDLKAPLAAITGYVATLRRRGDSIGPELRQEILDHLADASARLNTAVEQLVDYARIVSGRFVPELVQLDVKTAVEAAVSDVRNRWPTATIEVQGGEEVPMVVVADPARLAQVLVCLLENGVRHGRGRVRLSVGRRDESVTIVVEDDGEGMPEEVASCIFDADIGSRPRTGQPRGLGIALHNAARFAEAFGGRLELVSARSGGGAYGGAVFRLSLPAWNGGHGSGGSSE